MAAINCSDFHYMTCILNKIFQNSFYLNLYFTGKQNKVDLCQTVTVFHICMDPQQQGAEILIFEAP